MAERWQRSSESPPRRGKEPYRAQRSGPVRRRSGSETDSIYSSSSSSSSYIDTSRYYPQNRFSLRKFFTAPSERRRIRKRRSQRSIRRGGSSSSIDSDLAYGTGWIHKHKENSPRHEKEPERPRPQGYEEGDVRRDGVERREGQEVRDQRWRHDQYEARETPERRDQPERSEGQRRREKGKPGKRISRSPTAAEILAVGNEIQELSDLISSGGRPRRSGGFTRGIPPSKVSSQHQVEDDDDWRTDDGHESADSVDSSLAYGGESSQGGGGWFGFSWGKPKPKPELKPEPRPEPRPVPKQKSSVVDPRLFGRQNSLNGIVTEPVGFGDVNYRPPINGFGSSRDQSPLATKSKAPSTPTPRSKSKPKSTVSDIPLQTVYPISTEDPQVFEPGRSSVSSSVRQEPYMPSRPAPPPIYHPQPITPVTQAIYDPHYAARIESAPLPKDSSRRGPSIAEAALAGVAAGAVGAAIASESKEERDGRRREDDRGLYDDSYGSKHRDPGQYQNKGDKSRDNYEGTKDRDYRSERRNEQNQTNEPRVSDEPSRREDYNKQPGVDRREQRDEKRRGETREERRARHREERRLRDSRDSQNTTYDTLEKTSKTPRDEQPSRSTVVSEAIPEAPGPLNPFQYQVADDAFPTPNISRPSSRPTRSETIPIVHTVEREPSFVLKRSESAKEQVSTQGPKPDIISRAAEQLSRSARIKDKPREEASIPEYGSSMKYNGEDDRKRQGSGKRARKDSRDGELRKAEEIYNEVEHSTAPIDAAAIAAAAAVVANETHGKSKSRKRRSGRHGEQRDEPREFDSERRAPELYSRQEKPEERYDAGPERQDSESTKEDIESARILDEADKAYREIVMARKIASSVIRSRSSSPDRSVVSKYKEKEEEEVVRIVTPPSMEDHKRAGPYDAPNADIRLDHILIPQELPTFVIPNIEPDTFYPVARDPDAERERPLLTLIRPTPIPSPIPEKQATTDHKPIEQPSIEREIQRVVPDAVPESTVDVEAAANGTSPSEIEPEPTSFSEQRREQRSDVVEDISQPEKKKPKGKKGSRWSMIASGIIGGVAGATIEGDAETSESKSEKEPRDHEKSIVQLPAPPEVVAVFQDRPQEAVADPPDAITAEEEFLDSNFDREEGVPEDTYRILDFSAQDNSVEDKTFEEKLDNVTETNVQEGLAAHDSKDGSHNFDKTWPTGSGGVMTDQEESTAVAPENNPPDAIYSDDAYQNEPVNIEMQPFDEVSDEKAEQPNSISNDQEDVPFQHEYNNEVDQQIIPLDDKNRVLDREPREPKGMPGSFTEDLGFIATLAAGLQDTGLNPNIVINDPSYLRRTSPPGSNDEGDNLVDKEGLPARVGKTAQRKRDRESEDQLGVVLPLEEALPSAEVAEEDVSAIDTSKLSKKEQKKRARAAQRQTSLTDNVTPRLPIGKDDTTEVTPLVSTENNTEGKKSFEETFGPSSDHAIGNVFAQYFRSQPKEDSTEPILSTTTATEEEAIPESPKLSKKEQKRRSKAAKRQKSFSEDGTVSVEQLAERGPNELEEAMEEPQKIIDNSVSLEAIEPAATIGDTHQIGKEQPERINQGASQQQNNLAQRTLSSGEPPVLEAIDRETEAEVNAELESISETVSSTGPPESDIVTANAPKLSKKERKRAKAAQRQARIDESHVSKSVADTPAENETQKVVPDAIADNVIVEEPKSLAESSQQERDVPHTSNVDNSQPVTSDDSPKVEDDIKNAGSIETGGKDDTDGTKSIASTSATAPSSVAPEQLSDSKKQKKNSGGFLSFLTSKFDLSATTDGNSQSTLNSSKDLENETKPSVADASVTTSSNDLTNISDGKGHNDGYENDTPKSNVRDESFLDNADTLGAGVGVAGAAAAQHLHENASNVNSNETSEHLHITDSSKGIVEEIGKKSVPELEQVIDPEITERYIRPAIDPQYGDLLPLPPSNPSSPPPIILDSLPELPDSRPGTSDGERMTSKEKATSTRKTPQHRKTPSQSAVPLKFIMGNRSTPSSPASVKSLPFTSASTSPTTARSRTRPASWENDTNEYKPLYLVETARRESSVEQGEPEESLPDLPPSGESSETSSQLGREDEVEDEEEILHERSLGRYQESDMSINTALTSFESYGEVLNSEQSTPKALVPVPDIDDRELSGAQSPNIPSPLRLTDTKQTYMRGDSIEPKSTVQDFNEEPLTSTIGYFASLTTNQPTNDAWLKSLPTKLSMDEYPPEPVVSMTRDRTSKLLESLLESPPFDRYADSNNDQGNSDTPPTLNKRTVLPDDETTLTSKAPVNRILFQDTKPLGAEEQGLDLQQDTPILQAPNVGSEIDSISGQVSDETTLHESHSVAPDLESSAIENPPEGSIQPVTQVPEPSDTTAVLDPKEILESSQEAEPSTAKSNVDDEPSEVAQEPSQMHAAESLAEVPEDSVRGTDIESLQRLEPHDKTVSEGAKEDGVRDDILQREYDIPIEGVDPITPGSENAKEGPRSMSIDVSEPSEETLPEPSKHDGSEGGTDAVVGPTDESQPENTSDFIMPPAEAGLAIALSESQEQNASTVAQDTSTTFVSNEEVQLPAGSALAVSPSESAENITPAVIPVPEESQLPEVGESNTDSTDMREDVEIPKDVLNPETPSEESVENQRRESVTIVESGETAAIPTNEPVPESENMVPEGHIDAIEDNSEPVATLMIDDDKVASTQGSIATGQPSESVDQFVEAPDALADSEPNILEQGVQLSSVSEDTPLPNDIPDLQREAQIAESKSETQLESVEMTLSKDESNTSPSVERATTTAEILDNNEAERSEILSSITDAEMNEDSKSQREESLAMQLSEDVIPKDNTDDGISGRLPDIEAEQFDLPSSESKEEKPDEKKKEEDMPIQTSEQQEEASIQVDQQISENITTDAAADIPIEQEDLPDAVVKSETLEDGTKDESSIAEPTVSRIVESKEPNYDFQVSDSKALEVLEVAAAPSEGLHEQSKSTSYDDYFPSTAALHRQHPTRGSDINEQDMIYFPSSSALLPVAAASIFLEQPSTEHHTVEESQPEQEIPEDVSTGTFPGSGTVKNAPQPQTSEDGSASAKPPVVETREPLPLTNRLNDRPGSDYKESKGKEVENAQQSSVTPGDTLQAPSTAQNEGSARVVVEEETKNSPIEKVTEKPVPIASEQVITQSTEGKKGKKEKKGQKHTHPEEDLANQPDTGVTSAKPATEEDAIVEDPAINSIDTTISAPPDTINTGIEKPEKEDSKDLGQSFLETSDIKSVEAVISPTNPEIPPSELSSGPVHDTELPIYEEIHSNSEQQTKELGEDISKLTFPQFPDPGSLKELQHFILEVKAPDETSKLDLSVAELEQETTTPRQLENRNESEFIVHDDVGEQLAEEKTPELQSDTLIHPADTDRDVPQSPFKTEESTKEEKQESWHRAVTFNDTVDVDNKQTPTDESLGAVSMEDVAAPATESFAQDKESTGDENKGGQPDAPASETYAISGAATDPDANRRAEDPESISEANSKNSYSEQEVPDGKSNDREISEDTTSIPTTTTDDFSSPEVVTAIESPSTVVGPTTAEAPTVTQDSVISEITSAAADVRSTSDSISVAKMPFSATVASTTEGLPTDETTSSTSLPEASPVPELATISEPLSTNGITATIDTPVLPTVPAVVVPPSTSDISTAETAAMAEAPVSSEAPTHAELTDTHGTRHTFGMIDADESHLSHKQLRKLRKKQRHSFHKSDDLEDSHLVLAHSEASPEPTSAPAGFSPSSKTRATSPPVELDESAVSTTAVASEIPALQNLVETVEGNIDQSPAAKAELREGIQELNYPPDRIDTSSQEMPADNPTTEPVSAYSEEHPSIQNTNTTSDVTELELNPTEGNQVNIAIHGEEKEHDNESEVVVTESKSKKKRKKKKSKGAKSVDETSSVLRPIESQDSMATRGGSQAGDIESTQPHVELVSLDTKEHIGSIKDMPSADHFSDNETKKVDEMEETQPLQANPLLNRDVPGFQDTPDPIKDIPGENNPSETPITNPNEIAVNSSAETENSPDTILEALTGDLVPKDVDANRKALATNSYKPSDRETEEQATAHGVSAGAATVTPVQITDDLGEGKNTGSEMTNDLPLASPDVPVPEGEYMATKSPEKGEEMNKVTTALGSEVIPETSDAMPITDTSEAADSQPFLVVGPSATSETLGQSETQQSRSAGLETIVATEEDSKYSVTNALGSDSKIIAEKREIGPSPVDIPEPIVSVPPQEPAEADRYDNDLSDSDGLHLAKSKDKIDEKDKGLFEEQVTQDSTASSTDFKHTSEQVHITSTVENKVGAQSDERQFSFEKGSADVANLALVNAEVTETKQYDEVSQNAIDEQVISGSTRFMGTPVDHLISAISPGKFARLGTPTLPSVKEEEDTQAEAETSDLVPVRRVDSSQDPNRDSGFVTDSPIPQQHKFSDPDESVRDSGVHLREWLPATRDQSASLSSPSIDEKSGFRSLHESHQIMKGPEHEAIRDAVNSLSVVSDKPSKRLEGTQEIKESRGTSYELPQQQDKELGNEKVQSVDTRRSLDNRGPPRLRRSSTARERGISSHEKSDGFDRTENPAPQTPKRKERYPELDRSLPKALKPQSITDDTALVGAGLAGTGITTGITVSQERRPDSAMSVQSAPSRRSSANTNRLRTPEKMRSESAGSIRSASSGTPPLRRSDRKFSRDLRSLSQQEPESQRSSQHTKFDLAKEAVVLTPTPTFLHHANPTANEGRVRIKDMADVYDGFGEGRMGSPMSPTRPHSMRRRQSLQVLDLEAKVEQLTSENFKLAEAKAHAENSLKLTQRAAADLADRDAEIESLKATINWLHAEVTRLSEVNDGLTSANVTLGNQQNDRYGTLERQHAQTIRELEEMREAHDNLAAGMEGIVADQVRTAVEEKDNEIARLRAELEAAQETIREMQHQILAAKPSDNEFLTVRDEDYFDMACQQLCQHVQQWVLRFSKFSDMRACRLTSEINNDKVIDRLDNAILDGSDVDNYLADRVRRRDVFMSMTMTMIWEFVFTRYLFGMDREQRQKLKSLEKLLLEVGPPSAVHQWRATTLTLLSKREAFRQQRAKDTEAVVNEILKTLFTILPPPSHLEDQIQHQLTRVMRSAVDLSIEMRTQRAEYMMLPPLQPEYDANGDLASKVTFNAALMNERSGNTISNEELEAQNAIVRIVLFPLVVKKGDDMGAGDEEIVVCPAQVLVANDTPRERRVSSRGSNRSNQSSLNNNSRVSLPSAMPSEI